MTSFCRHYYRIPFSETDSMGIVHHSNHARYFERGRIEFLRQVGLPYTKLIEREMQYPVLEMRTEFRKPLVFDETILIETWVSALSRVRLSFRYRIFPAAEPLATGLFREPAPGTWSAEGETAHCCVGRGGRPRPADRDVFELLQRLFEGSAV